MSKNALFSGHKRVFCSFENKRQSTNIKKKKTKQKKTKQKLIRRVWGQVRSPFGQPHLTLKPCKPNQKHKTKKQNNKNQNKPKTKENK